MWSLGGTIFFLKCGGTILPGKTNKPASFLAAEERTRAPERQGSSRPSDQKSDGCNLPARTT